MNCPAPFFIILCSLTFLLIFFFFPACRPPAAPDLSKVPVQYSTPESLINYYWRQLLEHNHKQALGCFKNYRDKDFRESDVYPLPDLDSFMVDSILKLELSHDGRKAEIQYRISCVIKSNRVKRIFITGDRLVLTPGGWRIKDVLTPK